MLGLLVAICSKGYFSTQPRKGSVTTDLETGKSFKICHSES